ncbi:hypothetical protein LTR53_009758 [Teratosphaeriaceae sp. CCFEE 6253]|nr:hypothetical protein LTR53_009758 [Teratosphaeriaceae sp. CCFEE 6253]
MISPLWTLLAAVAPAYGAVHETLDALPHGWTAMSRGVAASTKMKMQVALQYQNIDQLESKLAAVSTPGSPEYGQYLDLAEQNSLFSASSKAQDSVVSWLKSAGASSISNDGSMVSFVATVGEANAMLNTTYRLYTDGATVKLRTESYSIPDALAGAVDLVAPTTYFGGTKAHRPVSQLPADGIRSKAVAKAKRQSLQPACEITIPYTRNRTLTLLSPQCLKELYNVGNYSVDVSAGSTIAFGSFLGQSASYSDLAMFEEIFGIPSQNFSVKALINGGVDDQDPATEQDGEANLDVQNIIGLVDGLPVTEYITGGVAPFVPDLLQPNATFASNEPYLLYYQYLLSQPNANLPYVISNSYGDHENTVPERYAVRVCNQIGLMGLRGRTILESSGDEGVGAVCRSNDGRNAPEFTPQFPGTCPYVASIGGTQFFNPEVAWNASSGGFSRYFKAPWYQRQAVNAYLDAYINPVAKEYYSANNYTDFSGRGFPDISAHSLYPYYLTVINGTATGNGGTSAAAPVVAAIFALVNDARFRAGKPALGFVNPLLYGFAANTSAINDIVGGAALGCGGIDLQNDLNITGAGIIPYASWNATVGWDPATGLGTPNFMALKDLAVSVC